MIKEFVECFAKSIEIVDSTVPQAVNARKINIIYDGNE